VVVSRTSGTSFSGLLPHQEYSDPQHNETGPFGWKNGSSSIVGVVRRGWVIVTLLLLKEETKSEPSNIILLYFCLSSPKSLWNFWRSTHLGSI
jgi:hypothetical protein